MPSKSRIPSPMVWLLCSAAATTLSVRAQQEVAVDPPAQSPAAPSDDAASTDTATVETIPVDVASQTPAPRAPPSARRSRRC